MEQIFQAMGTNKTVSMFFYSESIHIEETPSELDCYNAVSNKFYECVDWCKKFVTCNCQMPKCHMKHEKIIKHIGKITLYIAFNLILSGIDTGTDIWAAKVHFE